MILDCPPLQMSATVRSRPQGRLRLQIDFPDEQPIRDRVLELLADVLSPGTYETGTNYLITGETERR
jgi:hypothetical protein